LPKLKLPRFFEGQAQNNPLFDKLKLLDCPQCGQCACLIRNGLLYGNDPKGQGCTQIERGQRIRCSNRGQRPGCGHSFAIRKASVIPNRSLDSIALSKLLSAILSCTGCVHQAWQQGARLFSLSTAYRTWRQIKLYQTQLRHRLCQATGPPKSCSPEPRLQLIEHLHKAFETTNPIQAFQQHFQTSVLPHYSKHQQPQLSI